MKKAALTGGAAVVLLISGGAYWAHTRTPRYALSQAHKAFITHDLTAFEKYVDVEGLSGSYVNQLLEVFQAEAKGKTSGNAFQDLGANLGMGLIQLMKPKLASAVKEQIVGLVEKGRLESKPEEGGNGTKLDGFWEMTGDNKDGFKGIAHVKKEGKIAYVGLRFAQEKYNTELVLDIKLRDRGGYWQIAEFSNLGDFIREMQVLEKKRLEELNKPILESMRAALVLESIKKSSNEGPYGFSKEVIIQMASRNAGQKKIAKWDADLTCTSEGKILKEARLHFSNPISAGKTVPGTWSLNVNTFDSQDNDLYNTPQANLVLAAQVRYIKFADGTELKLVEK